MFRRVRTWLAGLLAAILLAIGINLSADDNNLTWTAPTTNTDGSPLVDLAGYNVYHSFNGGAYTFLDSTTATDYLHADQSDGEHCYQVTAYRTNGLESARSNTACKVIDTLRPNAPTGLQVN